MEMNRVHPQATALKERPPFSLPPEGMKVISKGDWIWRREIALINPKNKSSNLVLEDASRPPGFWPGTPLHQHDKALLQRSQKAP